MVSLIKRGDNYMIIMMLRNSGGTRVGECLTRVASSNMSVGECGLSLHHETEQKSG